MEKKCKFASLLCIAGMVLFVAAFAIKFYSDVIADWVGYFSGVIFCIGCLIYSGAAIKAYKLETKNLYGTEKKITAWSLRLCASVFGFAGIGVFCALAASTVEYFGYHFLPIVSVPTVFLLKCLMIYSGISFLCFIFWNAVGEYERRHARV